MALEVRCPNCGSDFVLGNGDSVSNANIKDGIAYLVPKTIRNENRTATRLESLKAAGVKVDKLQALMQGDSSLKELFDDNDPIIEEISKGGFIRNRELFRRFITAQTFRLLKDVNGWTHAVRRRYDIRYVYRQTKRELILLCKLHKKCPYDIRFQFFTLYDMKCIFRQLEDYNFCHGTKELKDNVKARIDKCNTYEALYKLIDDLVFAFHYKDCRRIPYNWLNCFKGAGAYYSLQNIIRTHGLVLPTCKNMEESLETVQKVFDEIVGYEPYHRRWDIMLSLLTKAVKQTKFELKW